MLRIFLFAIFLVLFACKKNNDDAFILAYAELRIMEDPEILQKHGFSVESFENKLEEIKKEPERWLGFQTKLIKVLDSIAKEGEN